MSSKAKFQSLQGMHDILPADQPYWRKIQRAVESVAGYYSFQRIDTPIVEQADIFTKGVGQSTDIVEKEMYMFRTKGGDVIALRPEFTAGIVRAYTEHGMHNLPQPVKLWTTGPLFRHERPQAGRYRQLHQFNFEALGDKSPSLDGQIIQMCYDILKELGFKGITIEVNSIGDSECRPYFKKILASYFKAHKSSLCSDCQRRLKENPLRILDCKDEKCQRVKAGAPQILDHLCDNCRKHFKEVLEFLDELQLPYTLNPYLVRGLDYYTKTVFEIVEKSDDGTQQGSLVGGGRYDGLVKLLGGRDTPACGAAGGMDRIVNLMKTREDLKKEMAKEAKNPPKLSKEKEEKAEIFLAQLGQLAKRKSLKLFEEFREAKISVAESFSKDSLRTQLKTADKMGIRWVIIVGQKEALEDFITLRDMNSGVQTEIPTYKVVEEMKTKIS
jgi:histidyl-tRNA synthetase